MQVKEIVALAALNLGRDDLRAELNSLEEGQELSEGLLSLLKCYNFVENEIALEFFPLTECDSVPCDGGKIAYTHFSHAPVSVHRVENKAGESLNFKLFPSYLAVEGTAETVKVVYAYAPEKKGYFDECAFTARVSARLMSFGIASEFLLTCARYGEADMWQNRYKEALANAGILRRRLSVRARRWV